MIKYSSESIILDELYTKTSCTYLYVYNSYVALYILVDQSNHCPC